MSRRRILIVTLATLLLTSVPAAAHPPGVAEEDQAVAHEVEALHEAINRAVKRKDAALLRKFYAESYTHTDQAGRVQKKEERIGAMLAGAPMIETAPTEDLSYRVHGSSAIVVTGKSPLGHDVRRRTQYVRWIAVYVRMGKDWQLVASQATRVP